MKRKAARRFKPVRASDVTDEKLVAGNLRRVEREMRAGFALLGQRLETIMNRFASTQDDHGMRLRHLETAHVSHRQDTQALEQRVDALEKKGI